MTTQQARPTSTPRVDIVIVSYNTSADLLACLTSLADAPPQTMAQVWVVDNASADGSADRVAEAFPAVRLIRLPENLGFAAANNRALNASTAELVLLLNSDTIVPAGAIDRLVARLDATGATVIGPRLVDGQGRPEVSFGPMLSPLAEWRQRRLVRRAAEDSPEARREIASLLAAERDVDWVSGACLLVRRQAALDAGLLDERYFMYEEDVDFCAAIRARGGRVVFTPHADVQHLRGRSMAKAGRAASQHYLRSHLAFYEKHHPRSVWLLKVWMALRDTSVR